MIHAHFTCTSMYQSSSLSESDEDDDDTSNTAAAADNNDALVFAPFDALAT